MQENNLPTNWLSVDQAQSRILQQIEPVAQVQQVPLAASFAKVNSTDIIAKIDVPNFNNSAMDGFACMLADLIATDGAEASEASEAKGVELKVAGVIYAGDTSSYELAAGQCYEIMTGAMVPAGCDVVIPIEQSKKVAGSENMIWLDLAKRPKQDENVRFAGEDMKNGQLIIAKGTKLSAAAVGLLSSLGVSELEVYSQLKVGIISTGDELVQPGHPLQPGQIYDSNRQTLASLLDELDCQVNDYGTLVDDPAQISSKMSQAADECDLIISSGGVSVGQADYIKQVLAQLGSVDFWKIKMRPGRPLAYGQIGNKPFFGLPGNPVSVMVCFYLFVRSAILRRQGVLTNVQLERFPALSVDKLRKVPDRTEYQRGIYSLQDNQVVVRSVGEQGSGILSSMLRANCLIELPADLHEVEAGAQVTIIPFATL